MEKWKRRAINLLFSLVFGGRDDPSVIDYYPQKTRIGEMDERFFSAVSPERVGISSKRIYNMLCRLEEEQRANIHSLMVIAKGEKICECSAGGYSTLCWQASHSMAKTVVGMIIGRLVEEGKLSVEMRLAEIFPELSWRDKKFPLINIHHLLSMTAGVDFSEPGAVTEEDWTRTFFASGVAFVPGSRFFYNSMNTYMLVRIAERVSGLPFAVLAREKFFAPMGIKSYMWEIGPEGSEKGGWGLYMSPESWAKVGYMMLSGGVLNGRRILPEEWVRISSSYKATTPPSLGAFNYGYQMWVAREGGEMLFSGMLGQCVWICPKNDILVVMTGGNNELFAASPALEIVRSYLGGALNDRLNRRDWLVLREKEKNFFHCRRWLMPKRCANGLLYRLGIRKNTDVAGEWRQILGSFAFGKNNAGVLPLVVKIMQNSHGPGLNRLSVECQNDRLKFVFYEGEGPIVILASPYGYEENLLEYKGEKYRVMALAGAVSDREGGREYRLELVFCETSSVRRIRLIPDGNRLTLCFSETPNDRLLEKFIDDFSGSSPVVALAIDLLKRRFGEDVLTDMASKTFNPRMTGINTALEGYERMLCEMDGTEEPAIIRLVRGFIERILSDNDSGAVAERDKGKNNQKT